jgi:hypothetical protein
VDTHGGLTVDKSSSISGQKFSQSQRHAGGNVLISAIRRFLLGVVNTQVSNVAFNVVQYNHHNELRCSQPINHPFSLPANKGLLGMRKVIL